MSRTDKDMPWYAVAEYWKPVHDYCREEPGSIYRARSRRECDLPPVPIRHDPCRRRWRVKDTRHCTWEPDYDSGPYDGSWHRPYIHPPKWFVDHVYHNPERVNARDRCLEAMKEYRANGEVDQVTVNTIKHKRNVRWLWW